MKKLIILPILFISLFTSAQKTVWRNPVTENAKLHGQDLPQEHRTNYFQRLPDRVKDEVRPAVWNLSRNTAGETLQFYTNSPRIVVRYTVEEGHAFPHMPATGKSGVDLYAYDQNGKEKWCAANYSFRDTVTFNYAPIIKNDWHNLGYEYVLHLPPYNTVKWMEIGVDSAANFKFIEPSLEKPIIAYGTSITQGACASRPGMIWSSIVARGLRTPLINLGFSGNGRLEKGILDVIKLTPAKLVILDCMPNIMRYPADSITKLVENAVREIRSTQPQVPILITDHLGYPHSQMIEEWQKWTDNSIKGQRAAYDNLVAAGIKDLHYLSNQEIGMPQDGTVEAIHPSDYGMSIYGQAYLKKIREILHQPVGTLPTEQPVTQRREPGNYEWRERHEALLKQVSQNPPSLVLLGNSITHFWGGTDHRIQRGKESWNKKIAPLNAINMGMGYDMIENVLWRVYHGALDGYQAKKIIVTIGINNINAGTGNQVAPAMAMLIDAIKVRQPQAELVINGIYPSRSKEAQVAAVNKQIEEVTKAKNVRFNNFGHLLLNTDGQIKAELFSDGLHLNEKGYNTIVDAYLSDK